MGGRGGASGGSGRGGGWNVTIRAKGAVLKAEVWHGKEAGFDLEWGEWAGLKAEVEFKGEEGGACTGNWVVAVEGGVAKAGSAGIYE